MTGDGGMVLVFHESAKAPICTGTAPSHWVSLLAGFNHSSSLGLIQ